jgi:hypothetical protein
MAGSEVKHDSQLDKQIDPATGEYRVIAPGQTFLSVTEKITRIVLTPTTPLGWFAHLRRGRRGGDTAAGGGDLAVSGWRGHLGHHAAGGLGLCDYQFCLVDRHWPRGDADLGDSAAVQAKLAQLD